MKAYLRAASLLFNQPLLITPDMLELGVRWANQAMSLNIINIGAVDGARMMEDEGYSDRLALAEENRRQAIAQTGIQVVDVHGVLVSRGAHLQPCETMTSYEGLRQQLRQAVADPMVQHVVLDIDSPGGSATGAFELAADIRAMAQQKPITGVVNFGAYSGGYIIAAACTDIVVSQTSGVGSIGVIASHYDRSQMNEKLGIKVTTVYAGTHKNDLTPHEPISDQSLKVLNDLVQESYQLFVNVVADYRGLSVQQVIDTQAGLYRGKAGISAGLADRLQSPQQAVDDISQAIAQARSQRSPSRIGMRAAAANLQTRF
ncbi:S49 family peptidase [Stutzerimonas stutzeri]|uniref:S49 family peptidase n=1 Tax=Stutzerimonas stutzeri TaxID=316 RepID=UPI00210D5130|nr:S49 family peptidase [Stutzerimonas stutzeri]MCQ4257468.1 S49 family peptidase [Stutzerimonas stutzeri]